MKLFLVLAFLFSTEAFAQELDFKEYRKFLMSGDPANKKLAIQTTCTNSDDEVFRIGETGYDECLNSARAASRKKSAEGQKSENLKETSLGTTIRLGE